MSEEMMEEIAGKEVESKKEEVSSESKSQDDVTLKSIQYLMQEIESLKSQLSHQLQVNPKTNNNNDNLNYDELNQKFLENPVKSLADILQNFKESIINEISTKTESSVNTKTFWNRFFDRHPELVGFEGVIQGIVQEDAALIPAMNVEDLDRHIYKRTKKILDEKLENYRKHSSSKSKPTVSVSPGLSWPEDNKRSQGEEESISLSEALKRFRRDKIY